MPEAMEKRRSDAMEIVKRLRGAEVSVYAPMLPDWLLEDAAADADMQLFGMQVSGRACGAAVLLYEQESVLLQHIYIKKEYRGSGRGSRFLAELMQYAYRLRAKTFRVEYAAGRYTELERLLLAYPMKRAELDGIGNAECTLGELAELPYLKGSFGKIRALSECTRESLSGLYQRMTAQGLDLIPVPLQKGRYMEKYSAVVMEEGTAAGLLLVERAGEQMRIPYMLNLSHNAAAPIEMIRFAIAKGCQDFPPETVCSFAVVNPILLTLLEKLGIRIQKRQEAVLELSYFAKNDRKIEAYIETMLDMTRMSERGGAYGSDI